MIFSEDTAGVLRLLLKRFLIALPLLVAGFLIMGRLFIPGLFLSIAGGAIIARPIAHVLGSMFVSVIFPRGRETSEPAFSFVDARIMDGRLDEALNMYYAMLPEHSGSLELYLRIMKLGDMRRSFAEIREAFSLGLKNLPLLRDRKVLAAEYGDLANKHRKEGLI